MLSTYCVPGLLSLTPAEKGDQADQGDQGESWGPETLGSFPKEKQQKGTLAFKYQSPGHVLLREAEWGRKLKVNAHLAKQKRQSSVPPDLGVRIC